MRIGLEVHIRLKSKAKIFSKGKNSTLGKPNTRCSLFDLGIPGSMPKANKFNFKQAITLASALNLNISEIFQFDRKHYRYIDLPLGYQITQYYKPIATEGSVRINQKTIRFKQLHLEMDAAKTTREAESWFVDYNRAGVPLIEIVTQPDITSIAILRSFLSWLRHECIKLQISDCDLSKGDLRFDLNISCTSFPRQEIKNLNSLHSAELAIRAMEGMKIDGSFTWDWNESTLRLTPVREKELTNEYFYLREFDLPLYKVTKGFLRSVNDIIIRNRNLWKYYSVLLRDWTLMERVFRSESFHFLNGLRNRVQFVNVLKLISQAGQELKDPLLIKVLKSQDILKDRTVKELIRGRLKDIPKFIVPILEDILEIIEQEKKDWNRLKVNKRDKLVDHFVGIAVRKSFNPKFTREILMNILEDEAN